MDVITVERAKQVSSSLFPRHEAIIQAIRRQRTIDGHDIPSISDVVREAIEELGRQELGADRFAELMRGAA